MNTFDVGDKVICINSDLHDIYGKLGDVVSPCEISIDKDGHELCVWSVDFPDEWDVYSLKHYELKLAPKISRLLYG